MRVTQNNLFSSMRSQLLSNSERLLKAQEQVATQKRINRVSDDPVDAGRVLDLKSLMARSNQYLSNIDRAAALAGNQDTTLGQASDLIGRAKELLLRESDDVSSTTTTREAARVEISSLNTQMVQLANTRFDGRYVFSGFATDSPAYADASVAVAPPAIAGRAAVTGSSISDSTQMTFHNYQIQFTAAGQFNVIDTTSGATLLANQTYASGQPINFAGLSITISNSPGAPNTGDVYTVNTTAPGAYLGDGQVQDVEIQPGTRVPINIPGNRVFGGAGLTGGVDVFSLLNQVNTALRANDRTAISNLLGRLDQARTQITNERSSVGGRVNLLNNAKSQQTDIQDNLDAMRSNLEDIDVTEAMTNLSRQQNLYDATLSAAAKVVQPSLLDFLK